MQTRHSLKLCLITSVLACESRAFSDLVFSDYSRDRRGVKYGFIMIWCKKQWNLNLENVTVSTKFVILMKAVFNSINVLLLELFFCGKKSMYGQW